jgi:hypothetical protein
MGVCFDTFAGLSTIYLFGVPAKKTVIVGDQRGTHDLPASVNALFSFVINARAAFFAASRAQV